MMFGSVVYGLSDRADAPSHPLWEEWASLCYTPFAGGGGRHESKNISVLMWYEQSFDKQCLCYSTVCDADRTVYLVPLHDVYDITLNLHSYDSKCLWPSSTPSTVYFLLRRDSSSLHLFMNPYIMAYYMYLMYLYVYIFLHDAYVTLHLAMSVLSICLRLSATSSTVYLRLRLRYLHLHSFYHLHPAMTTYFYVSVYTIPLLPGDTYVLLHMATSNVHHSATSSFSYVIYCLRLQIPTSTTSTGSFLHFVTTPEELFM